MPVISSKITTSYCPSRNEISFDFTPYRVLKPTPLASGPWFLRLGEGGQPKIFYFIPALRRNQN